MKPQATSIQDAMKQQRPHDKIVGVLSNKFAVVKAGYTNGGYETLTTLMFLDNGNVYTLNYLNNIKRAYEKHYKTLPNITTKHWYLTNGKTKSVINDNRKIKHTYRKAIELLKE